jgi:hypothetical protein
MESTPLLDCAGRRRSQATTSMSRGSVGPREASVSTWGSSARRDHVRSSSRQGTLSPASVTSPSGSLWSTAITSPASERTVWVSPPQGTLTSARGMLAHQ